MIDEAVEAALDLENRFGDLQDVEWAHDGYKRYIVLTRPITTVSVRDDGDGFDTPIGHNHAFTTAGTARTPWLLSPATIPEDVPGRRLRIAIQGSFRRTYRTRVMRGAGVSPLEIDLWRLPVAPACLSGAIGREGAALRLEVNRLVDP